MLIVVLDGPARGCTFETERDVIETADGVRYEVNKVNRTASVVVPPREKRLCDVTTEELWAELQRRGWRPQLSTPMRRHRRGMPRAGFGQAPWPD